jgi:hypothetical protein
LVAKKNPYISNPANNYDKEERKSFMIQIDKVVVNEEKLKMEIMQKIKSGTNDIALKIFYERMKRGNGKRIYMRILEKLE